MKKLLIITMCLGLTGCARQVYKFDETGRFAKEPRLRPNGKGYGITVVVGYKTEQVIQEYKH